MLVSCSRQRNKMAESITLMEKNNAEYSMNYLDSLNTLYEKFVKNYPEDTLSPRYLLRAATNNQTLASYDPKYTDKAISGYETVIHNYATSKEAATALFMLGSVYENIKNDTTKAREIYTSYVKKYPDGEYAHDVNSLLDGNLGKTPEQLIEEWKKQGKIDTTDTPKPVK